MLEGELSKMLFQKGGFHSIFMVRQGYTLVELLVVMLICTILVCWMGPSLLRASRLEKRMRNEAYVRTQLALGLERIERQLSLAKSVSRIDRFEEGNGGKLLVEFPLEVGGISLESNRVSRVFAMSMSWNDRGLNTVVSNRNEALLPQEMRRHTDAVPTLGFLKEDVPLTGVSLDVLTDNLIHVTLSAGVPMQDVSGGIYTKTISVDRIVRLWNQ